MASYKDFLLCAFLCFQTVLYQFVENCTTVEGGMGVCVSLGACAPYLTLLQQQNVAVLRKLRDANCGYKGNDPYVCCPLPDAPTTPPIVTPEKSIPTSDFISAFPVPPVCGFSNVSYSRVVARIDAELGAFPWMTLLGYHGRKNSNPRWLCGGSLISQHHVLTAAHCIKNYENDLYVVRLGELNVSRDDEGATPLDILIKSTIIHEKYNGTTFTNDIGIVVLERDVEFTNLIRPICIPTRRDLRANSFVGYIPLFAGWGDTVLLDAPASHLQLVQLPVQDNSYCVQTYSHSSAVIDELVMCVGFKNGRKVLAQLDGGGPLMQPDYNPVESSTYFYQIGVNSYGPIKCWEDCTPDVFMRVTAFVPWLHKHMLGFEE